MPYEIIRIHNVNELRTKFDQKSVEGLYKYFPPLELEAKANIQPIIVCALSNNISVGVAIAECDKILHFTELKQLHVNQEHRSKHLGRQLLNQLVEEAKKEGGRFFSLVYSEVAPDTPALEKVLRANQWTVGTPFSVHCLFNAFIFNPPWIHHPYQLPKSYEEFLWHHLREEERKDILLRLHNRNFPAIVSPFLNEKQLESLNSLGLRHDGRVVGWMITQRINLQTISYNALYVEPSLQFLGPGIKLLMDAMLIQKKHPIQWAVFELPIQKVSSIWMRFIKRRLIPYADKVSLSLQATFYTR